MICEGFGVFIVVWS